MYTCNSILIQAPLGKKTTLKLFHRSFLFCLAFQELSEKTEGLINNLKSLAVENEDGTQLVVKLETLKERKLTSAMENFLYNLAAVEGLV